MENEPEEKKKRSSKVCGNCKFRVVRKIYTKGRFSRHDYDYQIICRFGLKNINSYASVISNDDLTCENYEVR